MRRRVAITGIGLISPIGVTTKDFWENCIAGHSVVQPIPSRWHRYAEYNSTIWSPLPDINHVTFGVSRAERVQSDPVTLLALCAAHQSLQNAKLSLREHGKRRGKYSIVGVNPERAGVFMGTGVGGIHSCLENHAHHILSRARQNAPPAKMPATAIPITRDATEDSDSIRRFNPLVVSMLMPNAVSASLGIKYTLQGPNDTTSLACTSGTTSIGHAFRSVSEDVVDIALSGGSEYLYDHSGSIFRGFDAVRALVLDCADPDTANRPFDKRRSGFLFSEGAAAVLVLEELERAKSRNAPLIAEVIGFGESFDAYNLIAPEPTAMQIERMIDEALQDAGLNTGDIQYVNAHGTGTTVNDSLEAHVLLKKFGRRVLINSTKSLVGHTLGASGALETAVTALTLFHQTTHVCRNLDDPIEDLNFARDVCGHKIDAALTHSFGFGGHNAGLVLRRIRL